MGNRPRIRASNAAHLFNLYPATTDDHWSVIRQVHFSFAEAKVASGEWKREHDELQNHTGYRVVPNRNGDSSLQSGASSSSITVREMQLNAGVIETRRGAILGAKSHTARMREDQRISRKHPKSGKDLPPEDAIERAQAKVNEWPLMHRDRAVRVYPKG